MNATHIPHSSSSYHSSWGTILSISSKVLITLVILLCDGAFLIVPVVAVWEAGVWSSCEKRTRGDVGEVGEVGFPAPSACWSFSTGWSEGYVRLGLEDSLDRLGLTVSTDRRCVDIVYS